MCCDSGGVSQVGKLYPVDEAATQPDFFTFQSQSPSNGADKDTASLYGNCAGGDTQRQDETRG
jgi:hypothetical protein